VSECSSNTRVHFVTVRSRFVECYCNETAPDVSTNITLLMHGLRNFFHS